MGWGSSRIPAPSERLSWTPYKNSVMEEQSHLLILYLICTLYLITANLCLGNNSSFGKGLQEFGVMQCFWKRRCIGKPSFPVHVLLQEELSTLGVDELDVMQ